MNPKFIFVLLVVCGLTHGEEAKVEEKKEEETLVAEARSDFENDENSISLNDEISGHSTDVQVGAAVIAHHPTYQPQEPHYVVTNTPYQPHPMGGISPVYTPQNAAYQQELGLSVTSYQQQHPGVVGMLSAPHPKTRVNEKKAAPAPAKDLKPDYYPKESSYASIPEQPQEAMNTARFVADPNRNQIIEEITPTDLQALTMHQQQPAMIPHQYNALQQPQQAMQMPGYNFNYMQAVPGLHGAGIAPQQQQYINPYAPAQPETATVKYDQTEHGFIDRVWGEVQTMRQTITNDFFGAIPAFFRNIWDAIVGAVSTTSARMLSSFDWVEAFTFVARQLS